MRIVGVCGSPRAGNTEWLLRKVLEGAKGAGASTELILLRKKRIHYCGGCLACDRIGKCHVKDDLQAVQGVLEKADVILVGTPTYYANMSGLLKNCVDRLNACYVKKTLAGKKLAVVAVGEMPAKDIEKWSARAVHDAFVLGYGLRADGKLIVGGLRNPADAAKKKGLGKKCIALGKKLAGK
jgi:multimeric flavodoxin WrbA